MATAAGYQRLRCCSDKLTISSPKDPPRCVASNHLGSSNSISPVCFCSICTKTELVSFWQNNWNHQNPPFWIKRYRGFAERRLGSSPGGGRLWAAWLFQGILIVGCFRSRHRLKARHAEWEHSSPVEPNRLQCWCFAGWKRNPVPPCHLLICHIIKASDSVLSSCRMICAWTPSVTDAVCGRSTWTRGEDVQNKPTLLVMR